jgi:hypothetical protein
MDVNGTEVLSPTLSARERRRSPRIEVLGSLHGVVVALALDVALKDVSFGGFAIDSPIPFPLDCAHQFRFTLPNDRTVVLNARVVHCRRAATDGPTAFRIGLQFAHLHAERSRETVEQLIDQIASVVDVRMIRTEKRAPAAREPAGRSA